MKLYHLNPNVSELTIALPQLYLAEQIVVSVAMFYNKLALAP